MSASQAAPAAPARYDAPAGARPGTSSDTLSDPARLAALHATRLLDVAPGAPPEPAFERLTRLAARLLDVPVVGVSLIDAERHVLVSCLGFPDDVAAARELPQSQSICRAVVASGTPLVVEDARAHPVLRDHGAVRELGVGAYAGVPLTTSEGHVLGVLCVADASPRPWAPAAMDTLRDLADSAVTELELRATTARLAERKAELRALLDHTEELVCVTDADGRATYVNGAWERTLGYTPADAARATARGAVTPADAERFAAAMARLAAGESVTGLDTRVTSRDGRVVALHGWGVPRFAPGPDGRPVYAGAFLGARDVTAERWTRVEREAAAARMRATEARFRAAMDASVDAVFILDAVYGADGRVVDFVFAELNARGATLLGMPAEDYAEHALGDLYPVARETGLLAMLARVADRGRAWEGELEPRDPRIAAEWLHVQAVPMRGGDGLVAGVAVTVRDVSARRRAEAALARERAFLEATLESLAEGVVACDAEGRLTLFNRAAREFHGLPAEPLPPDAWAGRYDLRRADGATPLPTDEIPLLRALRGEEVRDAEHVIAPAGRRAELVRTSGRRIQAADGARLGAVAAMRDVTAEHAAEAALAASEARYRQMFEVNGAVQLLLDARDGVVVDANPAAAAFYGWPRETLRRMRITDLDGAAPEGVAELLPTLGTGGRRYLRRTHRRADGSQREVEVHTGPVVMREEAGERTLLHSIVQDVTERVRAERLKDQLIATASHELRTPLTAIKGALDLLEGGREADGRPERDRYLLGVARRNVQRLVRLVGDLLDADRLEAGQLPLACESADAGALIGLAWDALVPLAEQAGVRLEADWAAVGRRAGDRPGGVGGARPLFVWADAERVQQVLTNLVGNAVKFSPRGGRVVLSAAAEPAAAGRPAMVRLSVCDEGRGIPADQLETVFERFVQVEAGDAREKGGAGLGLAICRAIVQQHGGRIWAESAGAGRGSTFHFTLPAAGPGAGADEEGAVR